MNKSRCAGYASTSSACKQQKQDPKANMYCLVCNESLFRCKCKRFRSNIDLSYKENKNTERAYDSVLILTSMILTYILYLRNNGPLVLALPTLTAFLIIRSRVLCLFDTTLVLFALELCRFVIFNYRLIAFLILASFLTRFVNLYTVYFLACWFVVYLIAKCLNRHAFKPSVDVSNGRIDDNSKVF